ncbi:Fe(2+) transport protein 1 [Ananas comosus]|uniref:Fe(2+) transport protein 1 n=1 Tax=Ananas comosus TaxID=4615 RepID=A0A199V2F8_ANACO|nr:Fe(2+) transport protein 1 [Ananas comosus]
MATALTLLLPFFFFFFFFLTSANAVSGDGGACAAEAAAESGGGCQDSAAALRLKVVAIASILAASVVGVCLPLVSRSVPALRPDRDLFVLVKAFASGVILATGYMHVLPDSFDDLRSPCLPDEPWAKFPFTTFIAMLAAVVTLMIDSLMLSCYKIGNGGHGTAEIALQGAREISVIGKDGVEIESERLRRNRIIAQVLEMGIVVHSVVIGLSMGASQNPCTIRPLVAALCFHQMFEGMGLGGCILQAEYGMKMRAILVFFFATTTPFGIVLGIAVSKVYSSTSSTALIVEGVLNAASAGLLNYMALVDLLSVDFMGPKLQGSVRLQLFSYAAVLSGAGLMSLMAKWA